MLKEVVCTEGVPHCLRPRSQCEASERSMEERGKVLVNFMLLTRGEGLGVAK